MNEFGSANAYWKFVQSITTDRRFVPAAEAQKFLDAVRATARTRCAEAKLGTRFFRAQVGVEIEEQDSGVEWEHPLREERMIPSAQFIKEGGRANPAGIAYFYVASDAATAMAEMRPWVAESISLALFETVKPLKIVRCQPGSRTSLGRYLYSEHTSSEIEKFVWSDIGHAFARPATREERQSAYIPTQVLAEAFKAEGFDGVAYHSSLERGLNLVIFDLKALKLVRRFAYTLKRVRYDFKAVPNYEIHWTSSKLPDYELKTDSKRRKVRKKSK